MFKVYLKKEFLLNLRRPEQLITLIFFSAIILLLLHFSSSDVKLVASFYWLQYELVNLLALSTLFLSDEESGMQIYIESSYISKITIWFARFISSLLFILLSQIFPLLICSLWFDEVYLQDFFSLFYVVTLVTIGFLGSSYLVVLVLRQIRFSSLVLPLFIIPLSLPLFIAGVNIFFNLIVTDENLAWLKLIYGYDIIFVSLSLLIYLLKD